MKTFVLHITKLLFLEHLKIKMVKKKIHKNIGMPTYTEFLNSHWKRGGTKYGTLIFLQTNTLICNND